MRHATKLHFPEKKFKNLFEISAVHEVDCNGCDQKYYGKTKISSTDYRTQSSGRWKSLPS